MSSIVLGNAPESLRLILVSDADFVSTLTNSDGNWSGTASIELRFDDDTVWPAVIAANTATWNVDKAVVDAVPSTVRKVSLFYTDGAADLCWAKGTVARA